MGRGNKLTPLDQMALERGGLDYLGPVLGGDVSPIAPLPYGDTKFSDVGSHRLGIVFPDSVYWFQVGHERMIQGVSGRSIPTVSRRRLKSKRMENIKSERLKSARIAAKFDSAADAARAFGWTESAYRHHENGTRNYGLDDARKYGRAFKVKPGWLLGLENVSEAPSASPVSEDRLIVNGSVEAGAWRASEHWDDERTFVIEGMPSPIPGAKRFGVVVVGNSMNEFYEEGTVLDCVSVFGEKRTTPETGDHVIVENIRPDGLRELTVKEYREENGSFWLVPRSTNPGFKPVEYPGPDANHIGESGAHVIAFVLADYPPQRLALMRRMGMVKLLPE